MKISRQLVIALFFILAILFLGLIFWPFVLNEIIRPISIVVWLLLRVFVLSIHQQYYWGAIIAVALYFLYRLLPQGPAATYPELPESSNSTLKTIGFWHNIFLSSGQDTLNDQILKKELIRLLIGHYATKQRTTANYEIYEALQQREIPIPEHIHSFLFAEDQESGHSLMRRLQAMSQAPQRWVRHLTGQAAAEHKQMINEVLVFLETALDGDKK